LPQQTFAANYKLQGNGEILALQHFAPAHTDTDIYVHFQKANVIQMGDVFFNGMYPYIDPGTGGTITGNIAACDKLLSLADNDTKIVAGHGPLGNKADLTKFRDMLVTARDRVQKLKSAGNPPRKPLRKSHSPISTASGVEASSTAAIRRSRPSGPLSLRLSTFEGAHAICPYITKGATKDE
jgi:glyoxylase-like metal-dependent hydrolase (beta-lactamase superfamily II)